MEERPMAKRTFASAFPAIAIVLLSSHAPAILADDGCTILQELVKANVYVSATELGRNATGRTGTVGSAEGGSRSCGNSARATSEGFSEALAALGMPVTWTGAPTDPVDYCHSRDLGRCYPSQHPFSASLPPSHVAFVYDAWTGIRKGVASQMPFGIAAGMAQFTPESLDAALASSLNVYVDRPVFSAYRGFESGHPGPGRQ
jgi:hypothetical protein